MAKYKAPKAGNNIEGIITSYSFQKRLKEIELLTLLSYKRARQDPRLKVFYENNKSHFI